VTGNFLAASGLSSGTLQLGTNLTYNINGGGTLTSQSNTINAGAAGLTGLSITASGIGTTNITVGTDTATISSAITKFVSDYNTVQNYISSQAAPGASANGNIIPGMFTGNMDVENIMLNLRQTINATVSGGTGGISSLNDLGILSNGTDNTLNASNTSKLNTALANNIGAVENLFTNPTSGLATTLKTYLKSVNGFGGVISTDENNLSTEITTVSDSITNLQTKINNDKTSLTNEFTQMELAINSINQQKNLLTEYFSSVSSNSAPTAAGSGLKSGSSSSSG
jgi:flagellar hook-associated protein 2